MTVHIKCGSCEKILKAPDEVAGKKVKWPHCGATLRIPPAKTDGPPAVTQPPPENALASLLDEEGFGAAPTTRAAQINACPNCGAEMPPGGVLCVNCGFHREPLHWVTSWPASVVPWPEANKHGRMKWAVAPRWVCA